MRLQDGIRIYSPSELNTYARCQLQHYYIYVDKIPRKSALAMVFGSALHEAIEKSILAPIDHLDMFDFFSERFGKLLHEAKMNGIEPFTDKDFTKYSDAAPTLCEMWIKEYRDKYKERIESTEDWCTAPISDSVAIRGRYDALTSDTVIDWKTAGRKPSAPSAGYKMQATLYMLATGRSKFEWVYFITTKTPQIVSKTFEIKDLQQEAEFVKSLILELDEAIRSNAPAPNGYLSEMFGANACAWCSARDYCEFGRKESENEN